jgi:hypothetical protein
MSNLLALALVTIVGGLHVGDADAGRGGRGGGMRGGGMRGGGGMRMGGARTSVSRGPARVSRAPSGGVSRGAGARPERTGARGTSTSAGRDVSRDVSRDVNRNVNRDVNIHGDHGYYHGGYYHGGAPIARAVATTAAVGLTAAAIGSIAYSLPPGCGSYYAAGTPYYNCGGVYYAPQYSGSDITYVVVENPEEETGEAEQVP